MKQAVMTELEMEETLSLLRKAGCTPELIMAYLKEESRGRRVN